MPTIRKDGESNVRQRPILEFKQEMIASSQGGAQVHPGLDAVTHGLGQTVGTDFTNLSQNLWC